MKALFLSFSLVLALAQIGHAAFGPAFSTGPVSNSSWIREAVSTLIVPDAPNPIVGNSVLWTGIGTSSGDLIQGISNNYPPDNLSAICSNLGGNWCVAATTLQKTSNNTQNEVYGPNAISVPGDKVKMHYVYNDITTEYDQFVFVNERFVSYIGTASGHAMGWGTAIECTTKPCGVVLAHTWVNTSIVLDTPDPNYGSTLFKSRDVTGKIKTRDGGKTWTVDEIYIPKFDFTKL